MGAPEAYTACAQALIEAAERRSAVTERITHLVRAGSAPAADDPLWLALEAALDAEDQARAGMRAFVGAQRASGRSAPAPGPGASGDAECAQG